MVDKIETKKVESEVHPTDVPFGETKESKKLEDFKNNAENIKAIAKEEGKVVENKTDKKVEVKKENKKDIKVEEVIELEREYVIPLKRSVLKAPQYRRAKKAIKTIREFLVKHMKVEDRDLRKIKIDRYLNNEVWFRGIKKPANKIKVKAVKKEGFVYVELAEIPEAVKFVMARDKKKLAVLEDVKKSKVSKKEIKEEINDGVADKVSEEEDKKSGAEKEAKTQKAAMKTEKHTTKGAHAKKTMPVRKTLK